MDELVRWLGEQLNADAEAAQLAAAAVQGGHWYAHSHQAGRRDPQHYVGASSEQRVSRSDSRPVSVSREELARYIARHDPARVLREIDAKRKLLALHTEGSSDLFCAHCEHEPPCPTLRLLALPYADRPGYREEWRP